MKLEKKISPVSLLHLPLRDRAQLHGAIRYLGRYLAKVGNKSVATS